MMKNHVPLWIRLLSAALCVALLAMPLSGCTPADESQTAQTILAYLQQRAYPRIYKYLSAEAKQRVTLAEFTQRYETIYQTIGLTDVQYTLQDIVHTGTTACTVHFTTTMVTSKLDTFTMDMQAQLVRRGGSWQLDWTGELILPGMAEGLRARLRPLAAKRGEIFDANGELLAQNSAATTVYVNRGRMGNPDNFVRQLAPLLGMTETDLLKKISPDLVPDVETDTDPTPDPTPTPELLATPEPAAPQEEETPPAQKEILIAVKAYPRGALSDQQQEQLLAIDGVGIDQGYMTPIRYYPYGQSLSHVLGYLGVVSQEDLALPENADLQQDALIGKAGLERQYESVLRGQQGYELVLIDQDDQITSVITRRESIDGSDLRLNIQLDMQQYAEMLMIDTLGEDLSGAVIVLEAHSGAVQAMASHPSFDPNLFAFALPQDQWAYLNDPANLLPLFNRNTQGLYPPGSVFKPFTALVGLEQKAISPNFVFTEPIERNQWTPDDDRWVYPPISRHATTPGVLNLANAMTYSDNIYFAYTAMQTGGAVFAQQCRRLGMEQTIPFDLPLAQGHISNDGKLESIKLLADSGYGQGEMLTTPVQMAALFASLANGGDVLIPHVVDRVCHTEGPRYVTQTTYPPEAWLEQLFDTSHLNQIQGMLREVMRTGTGTSINVPGLGICGKTGTAEVGNDKSRVIAWFIGYTTEQYDRLVCVMVEAPSGGGEARYTIAKELFKYQTHQQRDAQARQDEQNADD